MGIPKFYRWTSERYPCLSEKIKEYQIPEFDNLYLDMNGIIHNCSHPNDEDIHLRIPEEQIFKDIFHYIDFLFKMIKPCQVFFMAVDGVAPRAKMNQQRGRRFRSARLAEDQEAEAIRKGETLPSQERFDSNCITPGTEFMARLHEQLKYFVQVKVSTDPLWQRPGLVIYLSGHDVPGEGEHKIMDFIRHERSRADYEPVRHCLYGLDADLVMLGLSTHELQFSLLREEVKFSRPKKPRKNGKPPPKPKSNVVGTSYDLTNVSVFKFENGAVPSVLANQSTNSIMTPVDSALVKDGQSFLAAIEKPMEQLSIGPVSSIQLSSITELKSKENEEETAIAQPPPEESGAKGVYKAPLPEKTTFLLLHLSLMRDYIDFEFERLKKNLVNHPKIKYDLESIIDDWILMNILVGNDFVPHLPHVHIVKGALPMLYSIYTDVLPTLDGYINENGILNLPRFEVFISKLSQFDIETFRETYDDMKYMESKTGKNIVLGEKMFHDFEFGEDDLSTGIEDEPLEPMPMSPELKALAQRTEEEVFGEKKDEGGQLCAAVFGIDDDYFSPDDSPEMRLEFQQHKRNYYISKLDVKEISPKFLEHFCKEYIRAIQWVLLYYYKGVSSWGWFYPYHYAPFCSDLRNFGNFSIEFDKGQPFRPFEQLLAVLPAQSKKLLPSCYQWLMTDAKSPIVDFYPEKFEQDLNGKKQDWEAVVLIPFIDELKLLQVMQNEETNLNVEEAHRNSKGTMMLCSYSSAETGPIRSVRDLFPMLESSHVKIDTMDEVTYNPLTLPKGIHPKTKRDAIYQGFPTLKSKPVQTIVEKADIKVFDFVTREESMVLSLEEVQDEPADPMALSRKLIGRTVWVNWPHLTFAYVTGVLTRKGKYYEDVTGKIMKDNELVESRAEKEFKSISSGLVQRHLKCKGIKLGDMNVILYAKMMEGRKIRCNPNGEVQFETLWSVLQQPFALKTCMYEESITEIFYLDRQLATTYTELFKSGDDVFYLGDKLFGALGTVVGHNTDKRSVVVEFKVASGSNNEANLKGCVGHHNLKSHDYYTSHEAAGKCHISSYVLSRITGTVFVSIEKETRANNKLLAKEAALARRIAAAANISLTDAASSSSDEDFPALEMRKVNVGLDLKFNKKNLEVRGYTSKREGSWFYSGKAIELVNEFVMQFSDFVSFLSRVERGKDNFDAGELFPEKPLDRIAEMVEWLEEKGVRDLSRIPTNTKLLDDDDIDAVWKYILKNKLSSKRTSTKTWTVLPNLLLKPGLDRGCVPPIPHCSYNMLDRVVCIDRGAPIPVGRRGTIVGIQIPQSTEPEQIEESFKSTGAATLMTLIVLCDPAPDVFDNPVEFGLATTKENAQDLSGTLASLLRIPGSNSNAADTATPSTSTRVAKNNIAPPDLKPKLIKLYPYQLLNVTEGPATLREHHRDSKQVRTLPGFAMNGHVKPLMQELPSTDFSLSMSKPVRILQRPVQGVPDTLFKKEFVPYDSRRVQASKQKEAVSQSNSAQSKENHQHKFVGNNANNKKTGPWPSQYPEYSRTPSNGPQKTSSANAGRSDILPWPPQPLDRLNDIPMNEPFSVAAFLQQQFNAVPINKCKVTQPQQMSNNDAGPPKPKKSPKGKPKIQKAQQGQSAPLSHPSQPEIPLKTSAVTQRPQHNPFNISQHKHSNFSGIFSPETYYNQDQMRHQNAQPHGNPEPDILQMLNRATKDFNFNQPRQQSRKSRSEAGISESFVATASASTSQGGPPPPPPSWVSQPPPSIVKQLSPPSNARQPPPPSNVVRQPPPPSNVVRQPPPPSNVVRQPPPNDVRLPPPNIVRPPPPLFSHPPTIPQHFSFGETVPQRHIGFVPLAVSRNASTPRNKRLTITNHLPPPSQSEPLLVEPQPTGHGFFQKQTGSGDMKSSILDGVQPALNIIKNETVLKVTPSPTSSSPFAQVTPTPSVPQVRKSRLAANFGNN